MFSEWAVSRGRFGELKARCCISAGGVPRFVPPEGGFINFLAKMAESVSRYRWAKTVPPAVTTSPIDHSSSYDAQSNTAGTVWRLLCWPVQPLGEKWM